MYGMTGRMSLARVDPDQQGQAQGQAAQGGETRLPVTPRQMTRAARPVGRQRVDDQAQATQEQTWARGSL